MARAHSADGTVAAAGTPPQDTAERHGDHHSAPGPGAAPAGAVPSTSSGSSAALEAALDTTIEARLLERALTHRSYSYEHGALPHNERLEFLGDSVLGLVVTDALYRDHPDLPEGQLAKLRASVVNMRALAGVARELGPGGLGAHLLLGHGEETTGGRDKASILADATEAVLGAVYIDRGLAVAAEVILRLFGPLMREAANRGAGLDWKTSLQELASALAIGSPDYLVTESGPDHRKSFAAVANVGDESFGTGTGTSKKEAEQKAAEMAWTAMQERAAAAHHQQQRSD